MHWTAVLCEFDLINSASYLRYALGRLSTANRQSKTLSRLVQPTILITRSQHGHACESGPSYFKFLFCANLGVADFRSIKTTTSPVASTYFTGILGRVIYKKLQKIVKKLASSY